MAISVDFTGTGTGNSQYLANGNVNCCPDSRNAACGQRFTMTLIPSPQSDFTGSTAANYKMKEPEKVQLFKITAFT
jgi:hypothetical protein